MILDADEYRALIKANAAMVEHVGGYAKADELRRASARLAEYIEGLATVEAIKDGWDKAGLLERRAMKELLAKASGPDSLDESPSRGYITNAQRRKRV